MFIFWFTVWEKNKIKNHRAHKCAPLKFKDVLTVGKKHAGAECICPICYSCISCNSSCLIHIILQIILQSGPGDEQEGGWWWGDGTVQRQEKILHRLCRSVIISQAAAKMPRGWWKTSGSCRAPLKARVVEHLPMHHGKSQRSQLDSNVARIASTHRRLGMCFIRNWILPAEHMRKAVESREL